MESISQELRQAVLQAAIQGKLTKQLPEDGNAADLLAQIKAEKERLIKEKKIKKEKPLEPITEDEVPIEIPENWSLCRFVEVFNVRSALRIHESDWKHKGIPFLRGRELVKLSRTGELTSDVFISEEFYQELKSKGGVPKKDDVLITAVGTLGKLYVVNGDEGKFYYKDAYILCLENYGLNPYFIKYVLESPMSQSVIYDATSKGTTVAQLTIEKMKSMLLPLPPLAEQHRIVARVEELMAKIDELEKVENELKALHQAFPGDMKAALLQAAMQGKLTEQLPEDGNAEELLKQIKTEKEHLIKEKRIRKEKVLAPITEDEVPFDIPENWLFARLGTVISLLSGQDMPPTGYNDKGMGTIYLTGASNIDENGAVIINRWTEHPKAIAYKGDLLLSCKGTVGKTHILDLDSVHIARQFMALRPLRVQVQFIRYYILFYVDELRRKAKSMIPGIERDNVLNAIIPLPPLAEQKRIVERLDKLLPLCDSLQTQS